MWGISSVGRALAWHARGHQFKSGILHHFYRVLFSSDRSAGVEPSLFFCPAALSACRPLQFYVANRYPKYPKPSDEVVPVAITSVLTPSLPYLSSVKTPCFSLRDVDGRCV